MSKPIECYHCHVLLYDRSSVHLAGCPVPELIALALGQDPRNQTDDVGIDEHGNPFVFGPEASRESSAIVEHPDAEPMLIVARLGDKVGVRTYGPPSDATATFIEEFAISYRAAVKASQLPRQ